MRAYFASMMAGAVLSLAVVAVGVVQAQFLQIQQKTQYVQGADQFNQTVTVTAPVGGNTRYGNQAAAQPGATNTVTIGDGNHAGYVQIQNTGAAGNLYYNYGTTLLTPLPFTLKPGEPASIRVTTNVTSLFITADASNTLYSVNAFPN
jgi:hypothetical protein